MCLPFCSLVMKIMVLKVVRPQNEGTILLHQWPIYWFHFKWARVTPLLKGQSLVLLRLQKANPPNMPLLPNNDQLLPLSLGKPRLHFFTFPSLSPLALSRDHLALIWIGWQSWLRDCISAFLVLLMSYILPTTKFRFI